MGCQYHRQWFNSLCHYAGPSIFFLSLNIRICICHLKSVFGAGPKCTYANCICTHMILTSVVSLSCNRSILVRSVTFHYLIKQFNTKLQSSFCCLFRNGLRVPLNAIMVSASLLSIMLQMYR